MEKQTQQSMLYKLAAGVMILLLGLVWPRLTSEAAPFLEYGDEAIYTYSNGSVRDKNGRFLLGVGQTAKYTATMSVYDKVTDITWSISDTSVLRFASGNYHNCWSAYVTGRKPGVATLDGNTWSYYNGYGVYDAQSMSNPFVINVVSMLTGVTLDKSSVSLPKGETQDISIDTMTPDSLYSLYVSLPMKYVSENTAVATVNSAGTITGVGVGTTSVGVYGSDGKLLATCTVTVPAQSIESAEMSVSGSSYTYDGGAKTPAVSSVKLGETELKEGTDYTVSWSDNTAAGTASVTVTGMGEYTGTVTKTFQIKKADLSKGTVGSIADQQYTGKALKPSVTVKLSSNTLKKDTDYSVTYEKNTKVGTATVTVKGKGNYTGTLKKTFKIVEPTTPAKGKVVTDQKTGASYKITKAGTSKTATVEYRKPTVSKATVTIPDTVVINNVTCKVTSVASSAFKNDKKVKTVTVGKNVTSIGKHAFYGCTKLQKVTIGNKVTSIGDGAFYGCTKLSSLSLGSKVSSIGAKTFAGCTALKKVTIPAGVTRIGSQAFYGCKNLKSITIKTTKLTTKKVGSKAFSGTYSKATVKVPGSKASAYRSLLKARGISAKAVVTK